MNENLLTPSARAVKILIWDSLTDGYKQNEIAEKLGQQPSWVSERLASLRNELVLASGLFYPLSDTEYAGLRESILYYGIQSPILVGEHIALLDGRHRLLVAQELGITEVPAHFIIGLDPEQERALAISINAARRQLTNTQKRTLVEAELTRDPARSDRMIAGICGVSHPFVATVRNKLAEQQALEATSEPIPFVTDSVYVSLQTSSTGDGNPDSLVVTSFPVTATPIAAPKRVDSIGRLRSLPTPRPRQPKDLGYVTCCHGQIHRLWHYPDDTYRINEDRD